MFASKDLIANASTRLQAAHDFDAVYLVNSGYNTAMAQLIVGTRHVLQKSTFIKHLPGFQPRNDPAAFTAAKFSEKLLGMTSSYPMLCITLLKSQKSSNAKIDISTVGPYLSYLNQKGFIDLSFQGKVFQVKHKNNKTNVCVKNGVIIIDTLLKKFCEERGAVNVERSCPEGALLTFAFQSMYKLKLEDGHVYFEERKVPDAVSSLPKIRYGYYENPTAVIIKDTLQNSLPVGTKNEDVISAVMTTVGGLVTNQNTYQILKAKGGKMNQTLNALKKEFMFQKSLGELMDLVTKFKYPKNAEIMCKQYDCGWGRIGSALKISPCFAMLAGRYLDRQSIGKRPQAIFMGAAGLAHIRSANVYFETINYDLQPMRPSQEKLDADPNAVYIGAGNAYMYDYSQTRILISDIYNKKFHGVLGSDPYLHILSTNLMLGKQPTHPYSPLYHFDRVMLKGRLVTEDSIDMYEDCYPFIEMATGPAHSAEVYRIKFSNATLELLSGKKFSDTFTMEAAYGEIFSSVIGDFAALGSKVLSQVCRVIYDRESHIKFTRFIYLKVLNTRFAYLQLPIFNFTKSIDLPFERDWPLHPDHFPTVYLSKKLRGQCPKFLADLSNLMDMLETVDVTERVLMAYNHMEKEDAKAKEKDLPDKSSSSGDPEQATEEEILLSAFKVAAKDLKDVNETAFVFKEDKEDKEAYDEVEYQPTEKKPPPPQESKKPPPGKKSPVGRGNGGHGPGAFQKPNKRSFKVKEKEFKAPLPPEKEKEPKIPSPPDLEKVIVNEGGEKGET